MKYLFILITIFCIYGCRSKETEQIKEGIDYVLDSTLQPSYVDVTPFSETKIKKKREGKVDLKSAFNIAKKNIQILNLELHLPLQMCLFNDSIWIIQNGTATPKSNEVYFGGDVYLEIRESDGFILKRIIGE